MCVTHTLQQPHILYCTLYIIPFCAGETLQLLNGPSGTQRCSWILAGHGRWCCPGDDVHQRQQPRKYTHATSPAVRQPHSNNIHVRMPLCCLTKTPRRCCVDFPRARALSVSLSPFPHLLLTAPPPISLFNLLLAAVCIWCGVHRRRETLQ